MPDIPAENPAFTALRAAVTGATAGAARTEFLSLRDGARVFLRHWMPSGDAQGIVVCFHGAGGHGEFFSLFADLLTPLGAAVYVADYRGHGLSPGRRGDYPSFQTLLEDCREVAECARARVPGRPLFILGESMGGCMAVNFAAAYPEDTAGLILFSPALQFRKTTPWPQILYLPWYLFWALAEPGRPVINTKGREEQGIKNPLHVAYDKSCPLHLKDISTRYFLQLTRAMGRALNDCPARIQAPVILFQGGADIAIDPAGARAFMDRLTVADKQFVFYPVGFHALLTDPDAPDAAARLLGWIAPRLAPGAMS